MATYNWYATASSCPTSDTGNPKPGWYSGTTFITSSYKNPATGLAYTPAELAGLMGGGTTAPTAGAGGTTTPTTAPGTTTPNYPSGSSTYFNEWLQITHPDIYAQGSAASTEQFDKLNAEYKTWYNSQNWGGAGTTPTAPVTTPTITPPTVTTPTVTPAPPYEISPAQKAFEEMYGGKVTEWVEAGGYGIPEETQAQMIQAQTDVLKAKETEDIRVMRNNMERRGITNSGFVFSNEQAIRSNTSVTLANSIRDVQISSALMKLASFEKAMGAAGQFLGYLSEQSQLKYQPEFATWQAEQMAKMQAWQAQIDIQKMAINQAYQQQNITLTAQLQSQLSAQQHGYDIELAEMEIEANQKAAKAKGIGSIIGTIIGGIFSLISPTK